MKKMIILIGAVLIVCSLTGCNRTMDEVTSGVSSMISGTESKVESTMSGMESDMTQATASITEQEAKDAALKAAGFTESDVTGLRAELETEDGTMQYEIHFSVSGTEYDYEIDAKTGDVISSEKD